MVPRACRRRRRDEGGRSTRAGRVEDDKKSARRFKIFDNCTWRLAGALDAIDGPAHVTPHVNAYITLARLGSLLRSNVSSRARQAPLS